MYKLKAPLETGWVRLNRWLSRALKYTFTGWRQKAITSFFVLLTLAIIGYVVASNWDLLRAYQWELRPVWLFAAILFLLLDMLLGAAAWHRLVTHFANHNNARQNIKFWWYANLGRRIPGTVWYVAGRAALYEQIGVRKLTITLLSGLELAFILISGIVTTLLTLPFWALPASMAQPASRVLILLVLIPLSGLLVHPRVLEKLWLKLSKERPAQELRLRDTLYWLLFYVLIWVIGALVLFSTINFFQPLAISNLTAVIGIWALASSLSLAGALTLVSLGVREISLTLLLGIYVPLPVALIISIAIRLLWLAGELITVVLSLLL